MKVTQQQEQKLPNVVSSHAYSVDNSAEYIAPKAEAPADDAAAAAVDQAAAAAAGKETSTDDGKAGEVKDGDAAAAEAASADAKAGEKGEEKATGQAEPGLDLNAILAEINGLRSELRNPQGEQQMSDPLTDIDQGIAALEQQVRDGEITSDEFTVKVMPLYEQRVQINTERKLQQEAAARNVSDAQGAFIAQNPDFINFAQSPEAAAMINGNPVHNNVSAYYASKYQQAVAQVEQVTQELNALKAQQAQSIKNAGKEQSKIVGSDAGTDSSVEKLYRGDGMTAQQGGIAALQRARRQ